MAEIARDRSRWNKFHDPGSDQGATVPTTDEDLGLFWKRFEEAKIFVFDSGSWPLPKDEVLERVASNDAELDVPFQCCFFESLPHENGEWLIVIENEAAVYGALLFEIEPRKYDLYLLCAKEAGSEKMLYVPWEPGVGNALAWLNILWLDKLKASALGVEHVKEKIKIGSGTGEKKFHPIRQIIRVVPKNDRASTSPAYSREIDWTHRWTVRGHWRRVPGIGKARDGTYCVSGFTWVTDFIKGPEDAPLIEKVRFVTTPKGTP